jgi:hypothetical protein
MKNFFTLTLCVFTLSLTAQETITYPYNPDANSDQYVAVSDILETIAIYGSDYLPSEIMVGDTTLSNWILIINQTLGNQQAVIDSLQASLDSQDTHLYCIRVEYASTQALGGVEFLDPSGTGKFKTSNTTVGTLAGDNIELSFDDEVGPPRAILVYAYQANTERYVISHLDGGGNNAAFYAQGLTQSAHSSSFSIGNQVTTDLFTAFDAGSIKLDLSMANLDAVRSPGGFGNPTVESHAFIIFKF